jgi:CubicO group peptidase (beta-lactamase class C family)
VDAPVTVDDILGWDGIVAALAAQKPVWEPGTRHGYHSITYGFLVGEIVRRVSGKSVGTFLAEEIAAPLGLELYIGLPEAEHHRVAPLVFPPPPETPPSEEAAAAMVMDPESMSFKALFMNVPGWGMALVNNPRGWIAEIPAGTGMMTAWSLARIYAACMSKVDGVRLLSDPTLKRATTEASFGLDAVQSGGPNGDAWSRFGLGFALPIERKPGITTPWDPMLGATSFGHEGAGGSQGFGDRDARVGFGYVRNQLSQPGPDLIDGPRARVQHALRACL